MLNRKHKRVLGAAVGAAALAGCARNFGSPDLARLYDHPAQHIGEARTPVVVIPGILGSKLEDSTDGQKVWGAFVRGAADADFPAGARKIALPMAEGVPLSQLRDDTHAVDVLDTLTLDLGLLTGLKLRAYVDIMLTLAAGKYRDQSLGRAGAVDYGGLHYTCFQAPYDWRRDISEQAEALHNLITEAQAAARTARGLAPDAPQKVDVVAHSMGGMVLRYYLRYGAKPLPDDGSLPELTWAGAANVSRAVIVGTPNAGSVLSLRQLVEGWDLNPVAPNYRPAVLGTMPAIYQLLPRSRHARVVDAQTGEPIDIFDAAEWAKRGWGLAAPDQGRVLAWLLPGESSPDDRRRIAIDHLKKCLARAEQLHRALDEPASPPPGLELHLYAGDSVDTPAVLAAGADGRLRITEQSPGDGTVTRDSALMDERVGAAWAAGLRSPIDWTRVQFIAADHIGLTNAPAFSDNVLFLLLEQPRYDAGGAHARGMR